MPGPASMLDGLNQEQKAKLLNWLELLPTAKVVELVAKDPPEGFGIQTHVTSLRRFYEYAQTQKEAELREKAIFFSQCELGPTFEQATASLLLRRAYEFAAGPAGNEKDFAKACTWLQAVQKQRLRQQELDLARQKLELEQKRAELEAAISECKAQNPQAVENLKEVRARLYGKKS